MMVLCAAAAAVGVVCSAEDEGKTKGSDDDGAVREDEITKAERE